MYDACMDWKFAERTRRIRTSHIREMLKAAVDPETISFAGGLPAAEAFPTPAFAAAAQRILADEGTGRAALQYGLSEGLTELREMIAARLRRQRGVLAFAEDILITNGSQQALDLLGRALLNSGDAVVVEAPSYLGALQAFECYEPRFAEVPLEADGVCTRTLTETCTALQRNAGKPPLFYTTPNFQNPSGITCSAAKRREVARLADSGSAVVIEDDPYGELYYGDTSSSRPPAIRTLSENVILLGSFSKIAAPGLRIGWVHAPRAVLDRLVRLKQAADLHTGELGQHILAEFLRTSNLDEHIEFLRRKYRRRRDAMHAAMESEFPAEVRYRVPEGGMFFWCRLPDSLSANAILERARNRDVLFVPGGCFFAGDTTDGDRFMRLNFSNSDEDRIFEGIRRLGQTLKFALSEVNANVTEVRR